MKFFVHIVSFISILNFSFTNFKKENLDSLIIKVYKKDNKTFIKSDFVQYLTGDRAIEAAKKSGEADFIIKNGKKVYAVPNDYFIVNENKKIRTFELDKKVENFFSRSHEGVYTLTIENNKVIKIKEIFIP
ncbi:MAG: hypothetical protein ABIQ27_07630 [Flavobacterium sp.]|uniref:hypothetical protein n=1 Tax=Flavobacterium sp. TaxID=239 RepID=UPI0032666EF2